MADEDTKQLLTEWGFEAYIQKFADEDISLEILNSLNEEYLRPLIPSLGKRLVFLKKLSNYLALVNTIEKSDLILLTDDTGDLPLSDIGSISNSSTITDVSINTSVSEETPTIPTPSVSRAQYFAASTPTTSFYGETEFKKSCLTSYHFKLEQYLESSSAGKYVLQNYNKNKTLSSKARNILVDLIINALITDSCTSTLCHSDFENLSKKICDYFPSECISTYYIPAISAKFSATKKAINAKGKLVDKYRNLRRLYSNKKSFNSLDEDKENNDILPDTTEAVSISYTWLKSRIDPWDQVEHHWDLTHEKRKADKSINIVDFLTEWPILKHKDAYLLIERDFKRLYPENENLLLQNWEHFFNKLNATKSDVSNNLLLQIVPDLNEDCKNAVKISSLASLLPPTGRIRANKTHWKPSILECQNSMLSHAKVPADIDEIIIKRKKVMLKVQVPMQPFMIAVGSNLCNVEDFYVIIDELKYKTNSMLHAFDLCFKSFHVLNVHYPPESEHIWQIIQRYVYGINTKWDKQIPIVERVLQDLKEE